MNKLESCWPANGTVLLLLLQWLQDAPAYRDMQGGGAGLSAPAAQPMTPPLVGPCNLEAPRSGLVRLAVCLSASGRLDCLDCLTV